MIRTFVFVEGHHQASFAEHELHIDDLSSELGLENVHPLAGASGCQPAGQILGAQAFDDIAHILEGEPEDERFPRGLVRQPELAGGGERLDPL